MKIKRNVLISLSYAVLALVFGACSNYEGRDMNPNSTKIESFHQLSSSALSIDSNFIETVSLASNFATNNFPFILENFQSFENAYNLFTYNPSQSNKEALAIQLGFQSAADLQSWLNQIKSKINSFYSNPDNNMNGLNYEQQMGRISSALDALPSDSNFPPIYYQSNCRDYYGFGVCASLALMKFIIASENSENDADSISALATLVFSLYICYNDHCI